MIEHGHFRGTAALGDATYHADALLTADGEFRLYVGGLLDSPPGGMGFVGELFNPEESAQFSGQLEIDGEQGSGDGLVIGEVCAAPGVGRFCDESASAEVSISGMSNDGLAGEVRITTGEGEEIWLLDLAAWSAYYELNAHPASPSGTYQEELAQFAQAGDVIISIDDAGRLFFQAAASGCTGNGALSPHLNGEFYVFDVDLIIENCDASHKFLNNEYSGLATETQNSYWDYDDWLLIFVSTPVGIESPAAITMYANRL
ncbi:MAG: hypothetical protein WD795_04140 [Woeseia sp.]